MNNLFTQFLISLHYEIRHHFLDAYNIPVQPQDP